MGVVSFVECEFSIENGFALWYNVVKGVGYMKLEELKVI